MGDSEGKVEGWKHTASSVKKSISGLDGIVDSISASVIVYFPEPKANLRHGVAAGKLDSWGSHYDECLLC